MYFLPECSSELTAYGEAVSSSLGDSLVPATSSSNHRLPLCQSAMAGSRVTRNTPVETETVKAELVHKGETALEES